MSNQLSDRLNRLSPSSTLAMSQKSSELKAQGVEIFDVLKQNDAFHALQKVGGLVYTGPTGTNVNDVAVALLRAE